MARPAEFDRDEVIDQALYAFRVKGYGGTSVRDLEQATGLKPGSIYSAFGNKRQFYLETLTRFYQTMQSDLRSALSSQQDPVEGLRLFFDQVLNSVLNDSPERCCYVIKSALELSNTDSEVRTIITGHFYVMHELIAEALRSAQQMGRIGGDKNPHVAAKLMLNNLFGLNVESMLAPEKELLTAMIDELFNTLFPPR